MLPHNLIDSYNVSWNLTGPFFRVEDRNVQNAEENILLLHLHENTRLRVIYILILRFHVLRLQSYRVCRWNLQL